METDENRFDKEPRLCVARRFERLIERATLVKSGRKGSVLVVGLMVVMLIATRLFGKRGQ
jgi:hypothetical protein